MALPRPAAVAFRQTGTVPTPSSESANALFWDRMRGQPLSVYAARRRNWLGAAKRSSSPSAVTCLRTCLRTCAKTGLPMNEPTAPTADSGVPDPTFDMLALSVDVRRAVDAMGYRNPTPVQRAVFEPAAEGRSLVVQARTGTGKTAAFGLPIVDRIVRPSTKPVQPMVLSPTRHLAPPVH